MISFVGAGPGAPDLLTFRAADRLARADVVVWASSLVPEAVLEHCRPDVVLHDSKLMTLDQVCAVYAACQEATIVRLHSGDPTVFSAIAEQIAWCRTNGRDFEIVPGVSSANAAAAVAGTELTIPGIAQSVVLTRLAARTRASMPEREAVEVFARTGATLALFLSVGQVEHLAERLLAEGTGYTRHTPVAVVHRATWPEQRLLRTTIADMSADTRAAGFDATTMFLIGPALEGATRQRSHVYDPAYTTRFRPASGATDG